jgi:hypothetical protein
MLIRSEIKVLHQVNGTFLEFFLLFDVIFPVQKMNRAFHYSLLNLIENDL